MLAQKRRRQRTFIKRNCRLCENKVDCIDFKDADILRKFQTENGKILPRRLSGNCSVHQKIVAEAIKKARELALVL
ncbi:MAG: 30S ribosomal protein S18 [Candidatus Nanoarchaeia archaeon]